MEMKVKLDSGAVMPTRAHDGDAGLDLYTPELIGVLPGHPRFIDTGVHVEIPHGYVGFIKSKSGIMRARGITTDGTIDAGYTGSIGVVLINHGESPQFFAKGDKVAQLVIQPCALPTLIEVDSLDETERGDSGFGSTGR